MILNETSLLNVMFACLAVTILWHFSALEQELSINLGDCYSKGCSTLCIEEHPDVGKMQYRRKPQSSVLHRAVQ